MSDKAELIAGFKLTAEYVDTLDNTEFVVINAENRLMDFKGTGQPEKKVLLTIELNGFQMEYMPNKTSVETMCKAQTSYVVSDLVGFKGRMITQDTQVGKAIYVEKI